MKDIVTGLTRHGTSKLGEALIEKAQAANRESLEKSVVGHVETLLMQIHKQTQYAENAQDNIKVLRAKVDAIRKGEFTLSPYGVITLTDASLDKAIVGMVECVNCGCNLVKYGRK